MYVMCMRRQMNAFVMRFMSYSSSNYLQTPNVMNTIHSLFMPLDMLLLSVNHSLRILLSLSSSRGYHTASSFVITKTPWVSKCHIQVWHAELMLYKQGTVRKRKKGRFACCAFEKKKSKWYMYQLCMCWFRGLARIYYGFLPLSVLYHKMADWRTIPRSPVFFSFGSRVW